MRRHVYALMKSLMYIQCIIITGKYTNYIQSFNHSTRVHMRCLRQHVFMFLLFLFYDPVAADFTFLATEL